MASTDARPVPKKNVAFRHHFALRDNTGDLVTTWAGADSEVSLDGASFSDCTNEATEIDTSGCGYIDLTSSEMNADAVMLKITVTNTNARAYVITLFPEESGDIDVSVDTNNDKTGYTASTVSDKTGYSLTQTFPTNFATLAIDGSGYVTYNNTAPLDAAGIRTAVGLATANLDTQLGDIPTVAEFEARTLPSADYFIVTDYTAPLDAAGVRTAIGLGSANLDTQLADLPTVAEFEARTLVAADYFVVSDYTAPDNASITAILEDTGTTLPGTLSTIAGYLDTEIAAIKDVTDKLDTAMEADGATGYQFTTLALENAPSGGGGTTDWTADERTAIRSILGVPGSGTTPADPTTGILDTIRDNIATVDNVVDAILLDTGTDGVVVASSSVTAIQTGLSTLTTAQVNAEVLDVLVTDTFAQPSTVPAATSSIKDKLNWLFLLSRNKIEQTSSTQTVYADDGTTAVSTATVSDNGTTATRGEHTDAA